jgi:DNA (cytosine-5)-methyltransferase 1
MTMRELSLFSGAGGGLLGSGMLGRRCIGYVENNAYCQRILKQRIADGILDAAPIFSDIRAFVSDGYAASYTGLVDVVSAGFPCQPFSTAGRRKGAADERNEWPSTRDTIRLVRPRYAFLENVPGLISSGYFSTILSDLAEIGYDARWTVLGAHHVGAPHKRNRLWILATDAECGELRHQSGRGHGADRADSAVSGHDGSSGHVADAKRSPPGGGSHSTQPSSAQRSQAADHPAGCGTVAEPQGHRLQGDGTSRQQEPNTRQPKKESERHNGSMGDPEHGRCDQGLAGDSRRQESERGAYGGKPDRPSGGTVGNPATTGFPDRSDDAVGQPTEIPKSQRSDWWTVEPDVGRVAHGVAARVDRLKALGNGQVPAVAAAAWLLLTQERL